MWSRQISEHWELTLIHGMAVITRDRAQDNYPAFLFCASTSTRVTLCQLNDEDRGYYQTTPNEGSWQLPHGRRTANHLALTKRDLCA